MERKPVRLTLAVLVTCMLLAVATPLHAQEGKTFNLYVNASANEGLTGLGDRVKTGYGGSAGFGLVPRPLSSGDIEFILTVAYDYLPTNSEVGHDFTFIRTGLDFKLRWWQSKTTTPFFVLGGGVSFVKWSGYDRGDITVPKLDETKPYIAPGLGLEFDRGKVSPYVELRLVSISGQRFGDYRYARASAGLSF